MLLHLDLAAEIRTAAFRELVQLYDADRLQQMILNLVQRPATRTGAVNAVGEVARLFRRISEETWQAVGDLKGNEDSEVRLEVAHALGKIGSECGERTEECRILLQVLADDPKLSVRTKAMAALKKLPSQPPKALESGAGVGRMGTSPTSGRLADERHS